MCITIHVLKLRKWIILISILLIYLALASCHVSYAMKKDRFLNSVDAPPVSNKVFTFNLDKYVKYWPHFEFAIDGGGYILCWWHLGNDPYQKMLGGTLVFNHQGQVIDVQKNENSLKKEYIDLFPSATYRQKWPDFIKNADGYGFSDDGCYGIRLFEDRLWGDWNAELWKICEKRQLLWKIDKFTREGLYPIIKFIRYKGEECIIVAFNVGKAIVVAQENGKVLDSFEYGPQDNEEILKEIKKKFHISCPEGVNECDLDFSSSKLAYDSTNRLLASGDGHSQRVRIVEIDPPHKMIIELNSECNPRQPKGGTWKVTKLGFTKDGKYLLVEYDYQSLITGVSFSPTEIIDTETWQYCWFENSEEISEVTLSPDGKMIAYKRGSVLEVGSFVPVPGS